MRARGPLARAARARRRFTPVPLLALLLMAAIAASAARPPSSRPATIAALRSDDPSPPPPPTPPLTPTPPPPSLQLAARQRLLDYAVSQALDALDARARTLALPDYESSFHVPLVGTVDVAARRLNVSRLLVPRDTTRVSIEAGYFHASAVNVTAVVEFEWSWKRGRLSGEGTAELALEGGALDDVFAVRNARRRQRRQGQGKRSLEEQQGQVVVEEEDEDDGEKGGGGGASVPQIVTVSSALAFQSIRLTVRASSADWLYQALLYLFGRAARAGIEGALAKALSEDVPEAANAALATLPTSAAIGGGGGGSSAGSVPLEAVFTFAVYTLNYVLVSGYTQVAGAEDDDGGNNGGNGGDAPPAPPPPPPPLGPCPFQPTPQPLTPAQIGADPAMATLYAHDAALSCLSWAAHASGAMPRVVSITDGSLPGVPRLRADVFGALVPSLPVWFRGHSLRLDVEVLEAPNVRFLGSEGSAEVAVRYLTNVTVLPLETEDKAAAVFAGPPPLALAVAPPKPLPSADPREALVAVLDANLTLVVKPGWESTTLVSAKASYTALASSLPVDVLGWQQAAEWGARAATATRARAEKLGLRALWESYAATPVSPWFSLRDVRVEVLDRWIGLSADVEVEVPPSEGPAPPEPPLPPPPDAPPAAPPPSVAKRPESQTK